MVAISDKRERKEFAQWLDTFINEKGLDRFHVFEIQGEDWWNIIEFGALVETMKATSTNEQRGIKAMLVRLDFFNQPIMPYFEHLAKAMSR